MTVRNKTIDPPKVQALKAAPRPRGRPAMGLKNACRYTITVVELINWGWPPTEPCAKSQSNIEKRPSTFGHVEN